MKNRLDNTRELQQSFNRLNTACKTTATVGALIATGFVVNRVCYGFSDNCLSSNSSGFRLEDWIGLGATVVSAALFGYYFCKRDSVHNRLYSTTNSRDSEDL